MHQTSIDFDICQNRHRGNAQSVAAFSGDTSQQRMQVLEAIREAGSHGLSCDELSAKWGVGCNAISGRFSELKMTGLIVKSGLRPTRAGKNAAVYRLGGER